MYEVSRSKTKVSNTNNCGKIQIAWLLMVLKNSGCNVYLQCMRQIHTFWRAVIFVILVFILRYFKGGFNDIILYLYNGFKQFIFEKMYYYGIFGVWNGWPNFSWKKTDIHKSSHPSYAHEAISSVRARPCFITWIKIPKSKIQHCVKHG